MKMFALQGTHAFGARVAAAIGVELARHEEREFEDGEYKLRPMVDVRGEDVFVLQNLYDAARGGAADRLVRLLFLAAALRDHGAARITAVLPYLAFARKDRRTQPFDPVSSRYVAQLIEAVRIDAVIAFEVHNVAAFDNAFRIPALHLSSAPVLAPAVAAMVGAAPVVVASPDPGGVKRAQLFRETLAGLLGRECGAAYLEKRRALGVVSGDLLAGEVGGAVVVLVDDLIATGGTLVRAARTCRAAGATSVIACAAHGLFTQGAEAALKDPALDAVLITDTVVPERLGAEARARVRIVDTAAHVGAALAGFARPPH